jgi:hypothetical protein
MVGMGRIIRSSYDSSLQENGRQGLVFSGNCLEFLLDDGTAINRYEKALR